MKYVLIYAKHNKMLSEDESRSITSTMSSTSTDSFSSIQGHLETMGDVIDTCNQEIVELERQLELLQRPVEALELNQLGDVPFLSSSPFRKEAFLVKPPGLPGIDLTKRYPFQDICTMLRNHLFETGAVGKDGTITLTKQLQTLLDIQEPTTTFLIVLKHLRNVLV